jgi:hypothetical protein
MIINGKIVKDWDKYKIGTAYVRPKQKQVVSWDMEKLQTVLLWGGSLRPSLFERLNLFLIGGERDQG